MKKKRRGKCLFGCLGIFIALAVAIFVLKAKWTNLDSRYIERSTGFVIPKIRKKFRTYSEDVGLGAFLKVTPETAAEIIRSHEFGECDHDPSRSIWGGLFEVRQIPVEPFPPQNELVFLKGASKMKSWGIYGHKTTGRFWIVVLHPDMAGDPPPGALEE